MDYTEFYVTKGASVSNTNGGGPRLGADDACVYESADCTIVAGALTTVVDNTASPWSGAAVDDFLCWDTAGVAEVRRISAIAGANATIYGGGYLSPCTAGANKNVKVGGAFATVDRAASVISNDHVNTAGHPPRVNIKYNAANYQEHVRVDNFGVAGVPLVFEGYESTVGDGCPNGNLPCIEDNTGDAVNGAWDSGTAGYLTVRCIYASTSKASDGAFFWNGSYNIYDRCKAYSMGSSGYGFYQYTSATYAKLINCLVTDSASHGYYMRSSCSLVGCRSNSAGADGFTVGSNAQLIRCIADNPVSDGFNCYYTSTLLDGCIAYSPGACGVYGGVSGIHGGGMIINCIFSECGTYGISWVSAGDVFVDYNAFYGSGTADINTTVLNVAGVPLHNVALSASPFMNAASGDFRLNSNVGSGWSCRGAAWPGTMQDGVNIGFMDIGALQKRYTISGLSAAGAGA